eukprot:9493998-Pyramimonas_sp.AAC.2
MGRRQRGGRREGGGWKSVHMLGLRLLGRHSRGHGWAPPSTLWPAVPTQGKGAPRGVQGVEGVRGL